MKHKVFDFIFSRKVITLTVAVAFIAVVSIGIHSAIEAGVANYRLKYEQSIKAAKAFAAKTGMELVEAVPDDSNDAYLVSAAYRNWDGNGKFTIENMHCLPEGCAVPEKATKSN